MICGAQIARAGWLVVRGERLLALAVTREELWSIVRLHELPTHRRYHAEVVIRGESRQLVLLGHQPWRNMRAMSRAVVALRGVVRFAQAEMSKAKTVTKAGVR